MITLNTPIEFTPPPINGRTLPSFKVSNINYLIAYSNETQTSCAHLIPFGVKLPLWNKDTTPTYAQAGQWTDSDVDARVNELLNVSQGNDAIVAAITALYPKPAA